MTDRRHSRARRARALPPGYQFGDTAPRGGLRFHPNAFAMVWEGERLTPEEHLAAVRHMWNVIEGEEFGPDAHLGAVGGE